MHGHDGGAYGDDGVASSDGENVGAGDGLRAQGLDPSLDVVDDAHASDRRVVRGGTLLTGEGGRVAQQYGCVAPLLVTHIQNYYFCRDRLSKLFPQKNKIQYILFLQLV
jgi:hypothetical protein